MFWAVFLSGFLHLAALLCFVAARVPGLYLAEDDGRTLWGGNGGAVHVVATRSASTITVSSSEPPQRSARDRAQVMAPLVHHVPSPVVSLAVADLLSVPVSNVGGREGASIERYIPRYLLDTPPKAINEPDFRGLESSLPSRLKLDLLIEATGLLGGFIEPEGIADEAIEQLRKAFASVSFVPGTLAGQSVPSRMRIELLFEEIYVPVVVSPATAGQAGGAVFMP